MSFGNKQLRRSGHWVCGLRCSGGAAAVVAAAAVWAGSATPAAAQFEDETLQPPRPAAIEDAPTIRTLVVAVGLVAIGIGVNFIPSKRGHQD